MTTQNQCPTCPDGRLTVEHPTRCRECSRSQPNLVRTVAGVFPSQVPVAFWRHECHDALGQPTYPTKR